MAIPCTDWERTLSICARGLREDSLNLCTGRCDDTRCCIIQFCPPGDEHICSKHVEAWNKLIIKFRASSWLILINKLNRLCWFGHVQRMKENRIPKRVLHMNLGTTRLRGRPRNRWQVEVREDGRIVGGEGWQEKVRNREEWKKLLRTSRNRCFLLMPVEWKKVWVSFWLQADFC